MIIIIEYFQIYPSNCQCWIYFLWSFTGYLQYLYKVSLSMISEHQLFTRWCHSKWLKRFLGIRSVDITWQKCRHVNCLWIPNRHLCASVHVCIVMKVCTYPESSFYITSLFVANKAGGFSALMVVMWNVDIFSSWCLDWLTEKRLMNVINLLWPILMMQHYEECWSRYQGQGQVIPQYLWDVITCPCPWYLILMQRSWHDVIDYGQHWRR